MLLELLVLAHLLLALLAVEQRLLAWALVAVVQHSELLYSEDFNTRGY